MKIRTGFVSNSSSSSFMIYGYYIHTEDIERYVELNEDISSSYKVYNKFIEIAEKLDLDTYNVDGEWYIGKSLDTMRDDQTYGDFKKSIAEKLKVFGRSDSPDVLEESWFD